MTKDYTKHSKAKNFETIAIKTEKKPSSITENSTSIYLNSGYRFKDSEYSAELFKGNIDSYIYSRYDNPNTTEFVEKMCQLEGMEHGVACTTGMSAVFLSMAALLNSGDHVVACRSLFGSSHEMLTKILPRWNITHSYVDINKPDTWEQAFTDKTKVFFIETPSNPTLDLIDIEYAANLAHSKGALLSIDNCFATPYLQQPAKFGADIILHSATKYIDGQGRVMGGVLLHKQEILEPIQFMTRQSGPIMSAFNAWLLSKSLETLAIRMERHSDNALELAKRLSSHPQVVSVIYPHLESHPQYEIAKKQMKKGGGLVSFKLNGGVKRCIEFVDSLQDIVISSNLGDSRTMMTHPFLTTHSKLSPEERFKVNIDDELLRISVGLEHIDDVWQDIEQAIEKTASRQ